MFRCRHIIFVTAILSVALAAAAAGFYAYAGERARRDDFGVYAAFLARLSHDAPHSRFALGDTSSKLTAPTAEETWIPTELRPYPPERAAPPDQFVNFCGGWCGH